MNNTKTQKLTAYAVLTAIIAIMALTPVGYLKVGILSATFLSIPVAIGAIFFGPKAGAYFGFVFGFTSFIQVVGFGPDAATAAFYWSITPIGYAIMCFVPRIFVGVVCGYMFLLLKKICKSKTVNFSLSCLAAALTNTVLFLFTMWIFFQNNETFLSLTGGSKNFLICILAIGSWNVIVEAAAGLIIGGALCLGINRSRVLNNLSKVNE